MNRVLFVAAFAGALFASATASAGREKIHIDPVVPYADADVGTTKLREQCDWNRKLPRGIVNASDGRVAIAKDGLAGKRTTLVMRITAVNIRGGGMYTGDKTARLAGELRRGEEVLARFDLRASTEGSLGACGAAASLGRRLADDVGRWVLAQPLDPAKAE
jgi:hypothetical protein